jgi:hypothetical protein
MESSLSALGLLWSRLLLYVLVLLPFPSDVLDSMTFRLKALAPSARITPGTITLSKMTEGSLQTRKMMTRTAKMNSLMPPNFKPRLPTSLSPSYTRQRQRKRTRLYHRLSPPPPPRVSSCPHRNSSFSLVLPVQRLHPAQPSKQPLRSRSRRQKRRVGVYPEDKVYEEDIGLSVSFKEFVACSFSCFPDTFFAWGGRGGWGGWWEEEEVYWSEGE